MSTWSVARTSLCAGAVVAAIQAALLAAGNGAVLHGTLIDPDCYMHVQRALHMMIEGRWNDVLDLNVNAPFGYSIHWTALFDDLLVLGATPFTWFGLDRHAALLLWGSAISPILLMAALSILAWGVRTRISGLQFIWLTVLIFTQPQLAISFAAGRPDHQSLVIGLLIAQLAWTYAMFDGRAGRRAAVLAGIMAGVQLSTSVEALLTILLISVGITAAWLFYQKRHVEDLAIYLGACVLTVLAWLVWEGGQHLVSPAYERPSIAHVVVLGGGAVACAALAWAEKRGLLTTTAQRIAALGAAGVFAVLFGAATFPAFFLGPWAHLDPVIIAWHKQIGELQSLWPESPAGFAWFLGQLTAPLLALPLVVRRLLRGPQQDKPIMLLSLIGFVLFGSLALMQMRWSAETQAIMLLPWTLTTIAIMRSTVGINWKSVHVPLRTFALSAALLIQLVPPLAAQGNLSLNSLVTHPTNACSWTEAIKPLRGTVPAHSIVMTPLWYGPEIVWRTDLRVIAGPYEMLPALKDTVTFFDGSEQAARTILVRRHISYALVCKHDTGKGFGHQLAAGKAPDWMKQVRFPGAPSEFRLYRVIY